MTALLELEGVCVSYGGMRALSGVDLTVPKGCVVALLGANGAGKTTTLRTISGLVRPTSGTIRFNGERIDRMLPHKIAAKGILHVPEGRGIFRTLTVEENLAMAQYARTPASPSDLVDSAVSRFPVLGERLRQQAGTLSGGEQQMLALARAFAAEPELLLLDEISMGLAPAINERLFEAIREAAGNGVTMLLIEQYVEAALDLADYCYVLDKGEVVDVGQSEDLHSSESLTAAYLGADL